MKKYPTVARNRFLQFGGWSRRKPTTQASSGHIPLKWCPIRQDSSSSQVVPLSSLPDETPPLAPLFERAIKGEEAGVVLRVRVLGFRHALLALSHVPFPRSDWLCTLSFSCLWFLLCLFTISFLSLYFCINMFYFWFLYSTTLVWL